MLISAVITTYNSEAFIRRTINSILNQNISDIHFEIEIIVIDDCSTDGTANIVLYEFPTVVFASNIKNSGGPNKGRNFGLAIAKGDYINIVDHDDEWLPNKIADQLRLLNTTTTPIASSSYWLVDCTTDKKTLIGNKSTNGHIYYKNNETFLNKLSKNKNGEKAYIGSLLFHKTLKNIRFEEKFGMVDYDWLIRLFENNASVEINDPLYNRYFYGSNLSLNENYRLNDFSLSLLTLKKYETKYPSIIRRSEKRINGSMARYYYITDNMLLSRQYFLKSEISAKTILYYITSYFGSEFVKKHFKVFG